MRFLHPKMRLDKVFDQKYTYIKANVSPNMYERKPIYWEKRRKMNSKVTYNLAKQRLNESNVSHTTLELGANWKIIVSQYGGRIFGPFKGDEGESLLWMSDVWCDKTAFANFINTRQWNIGGDRFWLEPELPFFTTEKERFFDTYVVQGTIDPGSYTMEESYGSVTLEQEVAAKTFEIPTEDRNFRMRRTVQCIGNPFSQKAEELGVAECFGFKQSIEMEDLDETSPTYLEAWLLSQINPRGELIVPFTGKQPDYLDYYEPISNDMVRIENNKLFIKVTGDVRYKLGFRSLNTTGRSAYLGSFTDGTAYLFVRSFYNNPSSIYSGAPSFDPELYGYPLFLYNDPGLQGGFAEFENCGMTIGGDTGVRKSHDEVYYYFFTGEKEKLLVLANEIL